MSGLLGQIWRFWNPSVTDDAANRMGWVFLATYIFEKTVSRLGLSLQSKTLKELKLGFLKTSVYYRPFSSDLLVMKQVFIDEQYGSTALPSGAEIIFDAGANVGYSALYFNWRYPKAKIFAIEPNDENFKILCLNTKNLTQFITCLECALWPEDQEVFVGDCDFRGGGAWAIQVLAEPGKGLASTQGLSPTSFFERFEIQHADIFKIDIEGGEVSLFLHPNTSWLSKVGCLVVELHNDFGAVSATKALAKALDGRKFEQYVSGENAIICFQ